MTDEAPTVAERLSWVNCEDEELQPIMRKFFFAKSIWPRRHEQSPSSRPQRERTWAQVFEEAYGETLEEYRDWAKKHNIRAKIEAYRSANAEKPDAEDSAQEKVQSS